MPEIRSKPPPARRCAASSGTTVVTPYNRGALAALRRIIKSPTFASATFDTLKLTDKPKAAGIPQAQAEAVVRVIAEAREVPVTREYLDHRLEKELAPIRTDLAILKWMMGMLLAGVFSFGAKRLFLMRKLP